MSDRRIGGMGPSAKAMTKLQSENRELHAQIESLQRENGELKAELAPWRELVAKLEKTKDIPPTKQKPPPDIFVGSAITPEMRGLLEAALETSAPDAAYVDAFPKSILRDLLK